MADLGTGVDFAPVAARRSPSPPTRSSSPSRGAGRSGWSSTTNGQVVPIFTERHLDGRGRRRRADHPHRPQRSRRQRVDHRLRRGFNTSNIQGPQSFIESSLSISFSADGTTLYASDNDGIWQFKTVGSLANSSAGSLIGLNDLRSLGVPYEGQDSAVAVIDTGVADNNGAFRGRVAPGKDVFTNGFATRDTFPTRPDRRHRGPIPDERRRPRDPDRGRDRPVRAPGDDRAREHLRPLHDGCARPRARRSSTPMS